MESRRSADACPLRAIPDPDDARTSSRNDSDRPMTDFTRTRSLFHLPEGIIYLDGNSLGPLPLAARERVARLLSEEWGEMLIRGWNDAGWMEQPTRIGDRIGRLIGAPPGTVVMGDTLSIKVYQAVAAALEMRPERRVILSDHGNFPSDLYMAGGLTRSLGRGHEIRLVAPEDIGGALDESVAVLMLTEVDYRTGRRHDMARLTRAAHAAGALTVWDLAHSAGALPIDLAGTGADFAVGCTYKFLNAGPGAPAFIYVSPEHIGRVRPPSRAGWATRPPLPSTSTIARVQASNGCGWARRRSSRSPPSMPPSTSGTKRRSTTFAPARWSSAISSSPRWSCVARRWSWSARGPPRSAARKCRSVSSTRIRPCRRSSTGASWATSAPRTSCGSGSPRYTWVRRT